MNIPVTFRISINYIKRNEKNKQLMRKINSKLKYITKNNNI